MIKSVVHTKNYFQAPAHYFWKWTDNLEVAEWSNGDTICYRADLIQVLRDVSTDGLPPLSPLLLVMAACQQEISKEHKLSLHMIHNRLAEGEPAGRLTRTFEFLDNISRLPEALRKGRSRTHLLYEIFKDARYFFASAQLKDGMDELNSGLIDALVTPLGEPITREQLVTDLEYLSDARTRFPSTPDLELKLKTGISEVPVPAVTALPDPTPAELLEQLSEDSRTSGLAQLAKQLIPVLNIPMHSQGSGDQSYGGISDITNRGNYDRLLLSELAQDDLLLTARLVNNEALYFRREEPPENPKRQRTILLDVTLKMWGIPRVFAMSAALAFIHNSRHGELVEAFTLKGYTYNEINLASKEGIVQAMGSMHHALHCGVSLQAVINELPAEDQNEFILITEERMMHEQAFLESLIKIKESLSFIVTVRRTGEIQFLECIKGNTRVLNTAKLPLEELLFTHTRQKVTTPKPENLLEPAFISQTPAPLLFPKVRIGTTKLQKYFMGEKGLVVINETQRVLRLTSASKGARELLPYIEKGYYTFGWDRADLLYIAIYNWQRKFLKIYEINLSSSDVRAINLSDRVVDPGSVAYLDKENFFLLHNGAIRSWFDCAKWEVVNMETYAAERDKPDARTVAAIPPLDNADKYLERGGGYYSTMYTIRDMFITDKGKLVLGSYTLDVDDAGLIRLWENSHMYGGAPARYSKVVATHYKFVPNKQVKFTLRTWEDGSEAIIDSRGFLHLRSSDKNIPEITIVLITGTQTACWAADGVGVTAGSLYFIDDNAPHISVHEFYRKYLQPFIDRLK